MSAGGKRREIWVQRQYPSACCVCVCQQPPASPLPAPGFTPPTQPLALSPHMPIFSNVSSSEAKATPQLPAPTRRCYRIPCPSCRPMLCPSLPEQKLAPPCAAVPAARPGPLLPPPTSSRNRITPCSSCHLTPLVLRAMSYACTCRTSTMQQKQVWTLASTV